MQRRLGVFTAVLGLAGAAAIVPGWAQTISGRAHLVGGFTQLFISPCGEPYRGRPGEPYPVALWFKQADLNHDGAIDKAEFRADHAGFFDALDADGNGYLDGAEVAFYEHRVIPDVMGPDRVRLLIPPPGHDGARLILVQGTGQPHSDQSPMPDGAQGPASGLNARRKAPVVYQGAAAYGLLAEAEPVTAADLNLDSKITKGEFLDAADRRFALLDKRKDGRLTLDELPMTASQADAAGKR